MPFVPPQFLSYNMSMTEQIVNILLVLICAYHVIAGAFVLGPKSWIQAFGKKVYALNIPEEYEPRYEVSVKFLGLLAWTVAALAAQALIWPDRRLQASTLFIFAILFLARATLRILLKKTLDDAYNLNFRRSLGNIIFNLLLSLFTLTMAALRL